MKNFLCLMLVLTSFSSALAEVSETETERQYLERCTDASQSQSRLEHVGNPENLRLGQRIAILLYTEHMFTSINGKLWRGEVLGDCESLFVQVLDSALADLPDYAGTVYRGTTKKYISLIVNQPYPTPLLGYTSTTSDPEIVENFLIDRREVLTITTGKDISVYSGAHSGGVDEKEILLPRGTELFVTEISENTETLFVFDEETGVPGDQDRLVQTVKAVQK